MKKSYGRTQHAIDRCCKAVKVQDTEQMVRHAKRRLSRADAGPYTLSSPVLHPGISLSVASSRIIVATATATALPTAAVPLVPFILVTLARCRLDVSVVLVARVLWAVSFAFAPDLALPVHIFAAP